MTGSSILTFLTTSNLDTALWTGEGFLKIKLFSRVCSHYDGDVTLKRDIIQILII